VIRLITRYQQCNLQSFSYALKLSPVSFQVAALTSKSSSVTHPQHCQL
jgi:hypothetical protein